MVASANGTSNFCTVASDSPNSLRSLDVCLAQRVQHFLFGSRRDLLFDYCLSALNHCLQPQHIFAAQTGNRPSNVYLAACPLAKLAD